MSQAYSTLKVETSVFNFWAYKQPKYEVQKLNQAFRLIMAIGNLENLMKSRKVWLIFAAYIY